MAIYFDARNRVHCRTDDLPGPSSDPDCCDEIVDMAVVEAFDKFRTHCLQGTGWKPGGGASLTTNFLKTCLYALGNELGRRHRARERDRKAFDAARTQALRPPADRTDVGDPCQQAILREHLHALPTERTET
ncbi:hypothetical protein DFR76_110206 [Nocardia pseudobrasiliensis]|uniref:Uncharacterized protein n=1 Tax=Nocardia pseudobrasiliensis TaxID=45979 RepID=A0A370HYG8_9NOCA|nr:hypothetical protein DFR76_110206 [Nocardia pseudobrasiliensis]